jgi:hypothetical protein
MFTASYRGPQIWLQDPKITCSFPCLKKLIQNESFGGPALGERMFFDVALTLYACARQFGQPLDLPFPHKIKGSLFPDCHG